MVDLFTVSSKVRSGSVRLSWALSGSVGLSHLRRRAWSGLVGPLVGVGVGDFYKLVIMMHYLALMTPLTSLNFNGRIISWSFEQRPSKWLLLGLKM